MTDLSPHRESQTLDTIASGGVYVSLHTADEGDSPDGSAEVTATDYSRLFIAEADLSITGQSPTTLSNDNEEEFTGSAAENWGTVTHFAFWNTEQGGAGEQPHTRTVALDIGHDISTGERVYVTAGDFTLSID